MNYVSSVNELGLTGFLSLYGDELRRRAEIADEQKTFESKINLTKCIVEVCMLCFTFREKKYFNDKCDGLLNLINQHFEDYYNTIDEKIDSQNYMIWKGSCLLFDAQIELVRGEFNDALKKYCRFIKYIEIFKARAFDWTTVCFDCRYEVIYNICNMCSMLGEDKIHPELEKSYSYLLKNNGAKSFIEVKNNCGYLHFFDVKYMYETKNLDNIESCNLCMGLFSKVKYLCVMAMEKDESKKLWLFNNYCIDLTNKTVSEEVKSILREIISNIQ